MKIAVFSSDPILAEGLSCLLRRSGGHDVVWCAGHLGDVASLPSLEPILLIVTEGFDDPAHKLILRSVKKRGHTILLLTGGRSKKKADPVIDAIISRRQGVGALFQAIQEFDTHRRPETLSTGSSAAAC